jgi:hypothetical protein
MFYVSTFSKLLPHVDDMNKFILPTILELSEKWKIYARNIYLGYRDRSIESGSACSITFTTPYSLIYNLLCYGIELDLDLFKSVCVRGLDPPDSLSLSFQSDVPYFPLLDILLHACNKMIKTSPLDENPVELGMWLPSKGHSILF